MSIINQKKEIHGRIAAMRTSVEGYPKLITNPSFPSISNDLNPLNFLTDLLSSLRGMESLKEVIIDTLTKNLPNIEKDIKHVLKTTLNSMVSCQINPSIPEYLLHTGEGINLELQKIDFNNLLLTNPNTEIGKLLYADTQNGIHSEDFNTFLYHVIQQGGTHVWADCLSIKFIESGSTNNILNIKVTKSFTDSGKNLKDLNNVLVDSVHLLEISDVLTKLVDNIFGMVSVGQGKSKNQIINELKINSIIDSIMNQEDDIVIDDSFFEFDNKTLTQLEIDADNKFKGVKVVEISNPYNVSASLGTLSDITRDLKDAPLVDLSSILNNALDKLSDEITDMIPKVDKYSVKLDFISDLVKNLMKVIGNIIISPKIISILAINHQIIYGEKFDDPMDYIIKNKYFIKTIFNGIRDVVIDILLNLVLKDIEILVLQNAADLLTEQVKNTSAMINSLVGVPVEITRKISGITKNF